ncbi:hypothetical protein LOD99_10361 [Oopsacas minuta]|uniref:MATH domain-containing protein n=1 Tax=Oopsacas minuta TaxID=111878 RepID=A0AAV7KHM1_9METZ|nr:hypothetical protein LOD99_10361 [Oopsacas minuta]
MTDMKLKQIQTSQKLDKATGRITFLENKSKLKELSKFEHVEEKLETENTKIDYFEKNFTEKDSELKLIIEVLYSYTPLPLSTGQLEWKIKGVKQKIQNYDYTYSDPFYVGLYKCQGNILWNRWNAGVSICIMKGGYDDKLHWPIRYKYTLILLNHINSNNNYECHTSIVSQTGAMQNASLGLSDSACRCKHCKTLRYPCKKSGRSCNTKYQKGHTRFNKFA